jgi:hypothetical protein
MEGPLLLSEIKLLLSPSLSAPDLNSIGYWMSDKPLIQQALSSELAELLLKINSEDRAFAFLRGFWQATSREWNGIDRLR